jgi:hypothetical protein
MRKKRVRFFKKKKTINDTLLINPSSTTELLMLLYNSKSASTSLTLTAELKKWHTDQRLSQTKRARKGACTDM